MAWSRAVHAAERRGHDETCRHRHRQLQRRGERDRVWQMRTCSTLWVRGAAVISSAQAPIEITPCAYRTERTLLPNPIVRSTYRGIGVSVTTILLPDEY